MNKKTKIVLVIGLVTLTQRSILKLKENSLIGTPSQWAPIIPSNNKANSPPIESNQNASQLKIP